MKIFEIKREGKLVPYGECYNIDSIYRASIMFCGARIFTRTQQVLGVFDSGEISSNGGGQ